MTLKMAAYWLPSNKAASMDTKKLPKRSQIPVEPLKVAKMTPSMSHAVRHRIFDETFQPHDVFMQSVS